MTTREMTAALETRPQGMPRAEVRTGHLGRAVVGAVVAAAVVIPTLGGGAVGAAPVSAQVETSQPGAVLAKKKAAKGILKISMSGTGTYTVTGKRFRKTASTSKSFKVKPGRYTVKAPLGSAKPGTVRVRKGRTVQVSVSFRAAPNPTPVIPPPVPTEPPPAVTPTPPLPPAPPPPNPGGDLAGAIERVSVDAAGNEANGGSQNSDWSHEGSVLAFQSGATNLAPGDTNDATDVFVKNLETGEVRLVSSSADGMQGNDSSFDPAVSPDGSRIAFQSSASNLVPGDTNAKQDIFVKTLATGAIERITTAANGAQSNESSYWEPQWSPDGTRIAFTSGASNLVAGDTNNGVDLFVKTLSTGAIQRVNTNSSGGQGQRGAQDPAWSPDGTAIAFSTYASDLVPGDTNNTGDVFVKNLGSGAIEIVSKGSAGSQADGFSGSPAWSPDGTRLAFTSAASNLDVSDTNGAFDIFVKTLTSGVVQRVSTSTSSTQANGRSVGAAWSPDGTRIAFSSDASDLVSGDTNGLDDVFVKNLAAGTVWRVSTDVGGNQATDAGVNDYVSSWGGDWSPDGRRMIIHSNAGNLVPGDTNGNTDVFLKTLR